MHLLVCVSAVGAHVEHAEIGLQRRGEGEQDFGEAAGAPAPAPAAAAPNAWLQAKPAIQPPRPAGAQGSPLPRSLSPLLALPPPNSAAGTAQQQEDASSRTLVDAGPLLGRTSRAGWGPTCTFAHIGMFYDC